MLKLVLFDLDDTLFDHRHSSRSGLAAVQGRFGGFGGRSLDEVERDYLELLNDSWPLVLRGEISIEESRIRRFRSLLNDYGEPATLADIGDAARLYGTAYRGSWRPVVGALPLLRAMKGKVIVGIVTNNLTSEQVEKLRVCGLDNLIDFMITSEDIGVPKPDPAIFEAALRRANSRADETVMVGDSWDNDVLSAHRLGIRAVWLNTYAEDCPEPGLVVEIDALEPLERTLCVILGVTENQKAASGGSLL